MKKSMIALAIICVCVVGIFWGVNSLNAESSEDGRVSVKFTEDGIMDNISLWEQFKEDSEAGLEGKISLKLECGDSIMEAELGFNGENYYYNNSESVQCEYKYLIEVQGTMPMAERESHFIVLANEKYSFDKISLSLYSSNSEEAFIDYGFIYWY